MQPEEGIGYTSRINVIKVSMVSLLVTAKHIYLQLKFGGAMPPQHKSCHTSVFKRVFFSFTSYTSLWNIRLSNIKKMYVYSSNDKHWAQYFSVFKNTLAANLSPVTSKFFTERFTTNDKQTSQSSLAYCPRETFICLSM